MLFYRFSIITIFLFVGILSYTQELLPKNQFWTTNGNVNAIVTDTTHGIIHIGGSFSSIGPKEPYGTVFRQSDHSFKLETENPDGTVETAESDGNGGWFIGGWFEKIGECRRNSIGHIDSLGRVTPMFLNQGTDGSVKKIIKKDSLLYIAGSFSNVGTLRNHSGLIHSETAQIISAFPEFDGPVNYIISDQNGGYYISGSFNHVGDSIRYGFVHIDQNYGVTSFKQIEGGFNAMDIIGDTLFVCGGFSMISGTPRNGLAAFNLITGELLDWAPNASNGSVMGLKKLSNSRIAIHGYFNSVNGQSVNSFTVLDLNGNIASEWQGVTFNNHVKAIEIINNVLYVGGEFTQINSTSRNRLAAFNTNTGSLLNWNPNSNGIVNAIVSNGTRLFVGGNFTNIDGQDRGSLAGFDIVTGNLDALNISISFEVYSLSINAGILYFSGQIVNINGEAYKGVGSAQLSDNTLTDWKPNISIGGNYFYIHLIGPHLFYSGIDHTIGGIPLRGFAIFNLNSQSFLPINLQLENPQIFDMLIYGDTLFIAGAFTSIMGQPRKVAAIRLSEYQLLDWNPIVSPDFGNTFVWSLHQYDGKLFIGGRFDSINGFSRSNLASFSIQDLSLINWTPTSGNVKCIRNYYDTLIVGGESGLLHVNSNTGEYIPCPIIISNVNDIELHGSDVYVAGDFYTVNGVNHSPVLRYNIVSSQLDSWDPVTQGYSIWDLNITSNDCYIAGGFTSIGGIYQNNYVSLDINSGIPTSFAPDFDNSIIDLALSGDTLYFLGGFQTINGQNRNYSGAMNIITEELTDWNPNYGGAIPKTIHVSNNKIYVGGNFQQVDNLDIKYLAIFEAATSSLTPFQLTPDQPVEKITGSDDKLYIGGYFHTINNIPCKYITGYDANLHQIEPLDIIPNSMVSNIRLYNDTLYFSGNFGTINGQQHKNMAAYNLFSEELITIPHNFSIASSIFNYHSLHNSILISSDNDNRIKQLLKPAFDASEWSSEFYNRATAMSGTLKEVYIGTSSNFQAYGLCHMPVVNSIQASIDTICLGEQITIEISDTVLNDASMWVWYANEVGGIPIGTGANLNHIPTQTTTYFVRGEGNCVVNGKTKPVKITIYVDPIPPTVSNCPSDTSVSHPNGSCSAIVLWDEPIATDNCSALTLIQTHPSGFEFPQGTTFVQYDYYDAINNISSCSFSVTVIDSIQASYDITEPSCFGESNGAINITIQNGQAPYTINWNNGTYHSEDITNIPGGMYDVLIIDANGCIVEEAIFLNQPDSIPVELNVNLSTLSTNYNTLTADYEWVDCNNGYLPLGVPNSSIYVATQNGSYAVIITDNGCSVISECITLESVNIKEVIITDSQIVVYPIPTQQSIYIDSELPIKTIRIIGANGVITPVLLINQNEINLSTFPKGMYTIEIETSESYMYRKKLIKE